MMPQLGISSRKKQQRQKALQLAHRAVGVLDTTRSNTRNYLTYFVSAFSDANLHAQSYGTLLELALEGWGRITWDGQDQESSAKRRYQRITYLWLMALEKSEKGGVGVERVVTGGVKNTRFFLGGGGGIYFRNGGTLPSAEVAEVAECVSQSSVETASLISS